MILHSELVGEAVKVTTDNVLNMQAKYQDSEWNSSGLVPGEIQKVGSHTQDHTKKAGIAQFIVQEVDGVPTLEQLIWSVAFLSEDGKFEAKCIDAAFNNGAN